MIPLILASAFLLPAIEANLGKYVFPREDICAVGYWNEQRLTPNVGGIRLGMAGLSLKMTIEGTFSVTPSSVRSAKIVTASTLKQGRHSYSGSVLDISDAFPKNVPVGFFGKEFDLSNSSVFEPAFLKVFHQSAPLIFAIDKIDNSFKAQLELTDGGVIHAPITNCFQNLCYEALMNPFANPNHTILNQTIRDAKGAKANQGGIFYFRVDLFQNLIIHGEFSGLQGNATAAYLHMPDEHQSVAITLSDLPGFPLGAQKGHFLSQVGVRYCALTLYDVRTTFFGLRTTIYY